MTTFSPTQGRYLAYIHSYTKRHGFPPAESEIATAMCVMSPSVNQMIRALEQRGLISREPGKPRSLRILLPENEIPLWKRGGIVEPNPMAGTAKPEKGVPRGRKMSNDTPEPVIDLYILDASICAGPVSERFQNKRISRVIEIRSDQMLAELHVALLGAFDRAVDRSYEFNIGGPRRFAPGSKNYGLPELSQLRREQLGRNLKPYDADARLVKMADLGLSPHQPFGYCFDFEVDWYHFISLKKIEQAIATVKYPRTRSRIGKSPPQFGEQK